MLARTRNIGHATSQSPRSTPAREWVPILAGIMVVALGLLWVASFAFGPEVRETYFSPDRFAYKQVEYRLIPFVGIPATPPTEQIYKTPMLEYLHRKGFVPNADTETARWDFVDGRTVLSMDLRYAHDVLRWSEMHPEYARVLWPIVVELIRKQKYWGAEDLIQFSVRLNGYRLPLDEYKQELETSRRYHLDLPYVDPSTGNG